MNIIKLPPQPHPILSYLKVGRHLYVFLILFIPESWVFWILFIKADGNLRPLWSIFWFCCFLFSILQIFLVILDGWSRYQNYKRAKDQFYVHGFRKRIAKLYLISKCQRLAAEVAAKELGLESEIKYYYKSKKVKWYHFVPYSMEKDPFFLFKDYFWYKTFLEKHYTAKFNYLALEHKL